ncbi:triple helix repeat-containing collagen [Nostoc commune NIES-4072]|uniref:Triple helix repeat-containing collagen n=1 Tax=Nostoc commune NIES-4072 TaxID=2005467 RepID=A0A2R5FQN1_NOSCO|nr:collagen-like protein [Nostoc commune]BBD68652.1 triple helix repeat-containing collagen [Nostoc commune HK-02]GBG20349.1 triple helix repeat-containing collagen [Nostoc commune NIES-4072]
MQGIPGIPGRQGERGLQGIPGVPGRDGVTTVVTLPGTPGRQGERGLPGISGLPGRNGLPGKDGRDGKDVNPGDLAGLRALIVQQHTQTRLNSTTQHSTTRTSILTPILALLKQIYDIVSKFSNAAQLALLNIINNKLGKQVTGGLSQFIETIAKNTYVEKALALLTFAATVHNAFMLSNK